MEKKTIFITGASTGIGYATAEYFAKMGWNVAATMRTVSKAGKLSDLPNVKIISLDVTDERSISSAIHEAIQHFGAIDVVFNNAGYALVGAFEAMSDEQIKKQFDTNVFGVMKVTRMILPYFRTRGGGTIINTSSMGGRVTFPLYSVYHATKWALEGWVESMQFELRRFNIRLKNIEPGAIKTEFENALQFVSSAPYDAYTKKANQNMLDVYKTAPGPEVVAEKVFEAANDNNYKLRYPVGGQGPMILFLRWILPLSWFNGLVRMQTEKGA